MHLPPEQEAIRAKCFHPSGTFVEFPIEDVETSVPERFEKMVAQHPNNWAIVTDSESLTYTELNERANHVARTLVDRFGPGPQAIALLFESKLAMIVALLAILKAGKILVLLDPAFPKQRSRDIIADVHAQCLLVEQQTELPGRELADGHCELLDLAATDRVLIARDPGLSISPGSLAAISYTSGSTGKPKGVIWTHRNMLHQTMLFTNEFHHCERDRFSYISSGTAAAAMHPFYALLVGAAVMPFDVKGHGTEALIAWLMQAKVTVCSLSAPLFRNLAESLTDRQLFSDLRLLRLSSESAYRSDFDLYRRYFTEHCLLANGVGPSESFLLTTYLMDHNSVIDTNEIPIGYPVRGKEILVVDDSGNEIGPNQIGEIVVRSAYLSPGYWNLPELTAAKFESPGSEPVARLYRTGDLGLRWPDGCLIHKGRKDFRAKIRGYGVEPAEVESILRQHPSVREACVVARVDEVSGASRLIGYFTQAPGVCPIGSDLRAFLSSRLPDYMIPAALVPLVELPLTANGKINRAALPAPAATRPELNIPYAAPTNECEARLIKIWRDVLGLGFVGIHDDFFELGGDSLSAMRVVARIRNGLHAEVPFVEFYEAPTISALAALVQRVPQVTPGQQAALIQPRERAHPIPLSLGQERLWFLEQLEPHAHRYNLVAGFRLHGSLDTAALEWAINQIVKRHESLRTVFDSADGKPFQVVLDTASITVPVVDIIPKPTETIERALCRLCADEAQRPFDVAREPLLRAIIVRADDQLIALVIVIHHLVFDGWSMDIFARELSASYEAAINRQPFQLAPLPIQYADFAMSQRNWLQSRDLDLHVSYWRNRLAGISDLQLPTDRPRPHSRDGRATRQWFTITPSVTRSLKDISGDAGVTLFMTLLAAYQTLLCRYSGQDDICVGVPVAGRQDEALDNAIGFFLNMLVLRADLSGNPTFRDLLGRVRGQCVEDYDHQDVPFERLVEELQPSRMINHHPLIQASFALRHGGACALRLRGLEVQELELDPGISRFDLELYMEETEQGLHGFIAGSSDLFDAATIDRMVGHFVTLVKGIVADPEQRISELPLLSAAEKHQLLVEWNDTRRDYPPDKCTHELFEAQVEKTPDAIAVVFGDQQLTYRELNKRANQLAHYLRKHGAGPEVLVGICLERSPELIIALLGILKAGGAYVPLDPSYPRERLAIMLQDCGAPILITQQEFTGAFTDCGAKIISLDADWKEIDEERGSNLDGDSSVDQVAYLIYTSGSTGQPKGVAIDHRAVSRLVINTDYAQISSTDVMAQASNVSFDAAMFEIWGALLNGTCLVLMRKETLLSPDSFSKFIERQGITTLFLTTALFNQMVRQAPAALGKLRYLLFGGEAADARRVKELINAGPPEHLLHVYGPTETTTFATCYPVKALDASATTVPIGRPIANTEIYILDGHLNPVPVGVAGELHIGGPGVARGYLNRPELTTEKFIANPFSNDRQGQLYKTGDWARYLPDGNIEFLGRIDGQVKIRGYRIELGEIESVLAQHAAIQQAVVLAREDTPGDKRLVGYVVARRKETFDASEVRRHLKQKLPEYMILSALVLLHELPLTPSGKINRQALPAPEETRPELECIYQPPGTPTEATLAAIWGEVLKLDKVGIYDNFFDLGGHSLLATQVISRIRRAFSMDLPLRCMFESPTVAELAAMITQTQSKQAGDAKLAPMLLELEAEEDRENASDVVGSTKKER